MSRYFEEYRCGCVSASAKRRELTGYCPTHGESRRGIFREVKEGVIQVLRQRPPTPTPEAGA